MLVINAFIQIPLGEIDLSYARSSGPGGQNVNKVNSKAVLRWNVRNSPSIGEGVRLRLIQSLGSKITTTGDLVLTSDRFRDQTMNREDCFDKLKEYVLACAYPPKPRKKTKPSKSSKMKQKQNKRKHADKKSMRRKPVY